MAIRGIEWLGFYEAAHVSAKSEWMKSEITRIYQVPKEKITVTSPTANSWVSSILAIYQQVSGGEKPQ